MVTLDESIIARLKTHGKTFEVFVEPEGALALKKGRFCKDREYPGSGRCVPGCQKWGQAC